MTAIVLEVSLRIVPTDGDPLQLNWRFSDNGLTEYAHKRLAVAAGATATVWDPTIESPTSFAFLAMAANGDLQVELTTNQGHADQELASLPLAANAPLILGADDSYYAHGASSAYAGALDVIDKVRVRNAGASTVTLQLLVAA